MKKAALILMAAACAVAANARSLNVSTPSATYSFNAASMGDAVVTAGTDITIQGRTFAAADILGMAVVEEDVADNTVAVAYCATGATVTVAGNIAQYIDVAVAGAHVEILQSDLVGDDTCGEITYSLSGSSSDGSFTLTGGYKSSIDLCGVDLTNPSGAAIDIQNGKRIELSSKSGTANYLTDGAAGSQKAALYCKGHLELKGKGALTVAGKKGHAIAAKEYISFKNSTLTITESVKDGINCSQYFLMESGSITMSNLGDDAIQTDYKDDTDREAEDTGAITIAGGEITATVTTRASKALKAEGPLTVSGGTLNLTVTGGGEWDSTDLKTKASSCLNSDEDITISGGTMNLKATGSGGKGISCDGSFYMTDGTIDIVTSGGVFVYTNNTAYDNYTGSVDNIASDKKSSAKGIKVDTFVQIDGGSITVHTSGKNAEGIESKGQLTVNGGTIYVKAYDDAINSSSHMNINGGDITVIATNNDGLDANGNINIAGGYIRAFGAGSPECGIDANSEQGYKVYFTGGTLLAVGGSNSVPSTSASTQPYVSGSASVTANSTVKLSSGSTVLAEFTIPAEYGGSTGSTGGMGGNRPGGGGSSSGGGIVITCPGLTSGSSYTLTSGSSTSTVTAKQYGSSSPW